MPNEETPPNLKIPEITYSNFVITRGLYTFAKLGIANLLVGWTWRIDRAAGAGGVHLEDQFIHLWWCPR